MAELTLAMMAGYVNIIIPTKAKAWMVHNVDTEMTKYIMSRYECIYYLTDGDGAFVKLPIKPVMLDPEYVDIDTVTNIAKFTYVDWDIDGNVIAI